MYFLVKSIIISLIWEMQNFQYKGYDKFYHGKNNDYQENDWN